MSREWSILALCFAEFLIALPSPHNYMKLEEAIYRFGVQYHQYSDDTQLCIAAPGWSINVIKVLSQFLKVSMWVGKNRFQLNPSKTDCLWILDPPYLWTGDFHYWCWESGVLQFRGKVQSGGSSRKTLSGDHKDLCTTWSCAPIVAMPDLGASN